MQVLLCRIGPGAALRAGDGGCFPIANDEMRWQTPVLQRMGR